MAGGGGGGRGARSRQVETTRAQRTRPGGRVACGSQVPHGILLSLVMLGGSRFRGVPLLGSRRAGLLAVAVALKRDGAPTWVSSSWFVGGIVAGSFGTSDAPRGRSCPDP